MVRSLRLLSALQGVRDFVLERFKGLQDAAPQDEGTKGPSVGEGDRIRLKQDEEALGRLLSRAELELSNPEAVRRRETIARLKLAAASTRQSTPSRHLAPSGPPVPQAPSSPSSPRR